MRNLKINLLEDQLFDLVLHNYPFLSLKSCLSVVL